MKEYFVIVNGDGDTHVYLFTREELLDFLEENGTDVHSFLDEVPHVDTNYWNGKFLIIKGSITVPKRSGWKIE